MSTYSSPELFKFLAGQLNHENKVIVIKK